MKLQSSTSHLSDIIATTKPRADWSELRTQIGGLQPGDVLSVRLPTGVAMKNFRALLCRIGSSMDFGDCVLTTRREGDRVHCFLAAKEAKSL